MRSPEVVVRLVHYTGASSFVEERTTIAPLNIVGRIDFAIAVVVSWQSLGERRARVVDGGNGRFILEDFDQRVVDEQIASIGSIAGQIRLGKIAHKHHRL